MQVFKPALHARASARTTLLAVAMSLVSPLAAGAELDEQVVRRVHASALTIDAHLDLRDDFDAKAALGETQDQFDLPKLERGQLDVATIALFANPAPTTQANIAEARKQVDGKLQSVKTLIAKSGGRLELAQSAADLERIPAAGKHAILLSFLNALPLGHDLTLLPKYYDEGVRIFGFVHAGNNAFADSSRPNAAFGDKPNEHGGLTPLGKQAVAELNRLGVIIDVSQLTPAGVLQTVELSEAPVIASHSALRSRIDATRNLTDEELLAIANRGGVVHIVAFAGYLKDSEERRRDYEQNVWQAFGLQQGVDDPKTKLDPAAYARFQAAYANYSRNAWRHASLTDYLDTIDAAVKLVGIDHVGLSSDFNHGGGVVGFAHVGEAANVTRALLERGYSEADIGKLWGGNFLRVLKQVEAIAKQGSRLTRKAS